MKKVLITGSKGQLGQSINYISKFEKNIDFTFINSNKLNFINNKEIYCFFENRSFDYIVNCAAYTQVDLAEQNKDLNYQINANAVKIIAKICREKNIILIHISTDYVFDGESNIPYLTTSLPNPKNEYGKAKFYGELYALKNNPKTIIIRTSWILSPYRENFLKKIIFLFKNKEEISITNDQISAPTLSFDLAKTIIKIINSINKKYGIYHYTNSNPINRFDFSLKIKNEIEKKNYTFIKIKKIYPIKTKEYFETVHRPLYSVLNLQKIKKDYNIKIFNWNKKINKIIKFYISNSIF